MTPDRHKQPRWLTSAIIAIIVLVALGTGVVTMLTIDTAEAPIPVGRDVGVVGISTGDIFEEMTPTQIADYMEAVRDLGVTRVRIDLKWDGVQRRAGGSYDWSHLHTVIGAASERGIFISGIINGVPGWASSCEKEPWKCAPKDDATVDAMAKFAGAAVKEFPGRIVRIEVGNEPNSMPDYYRDPSRYLKVYHAVYAVVKAENDTIQVMPGGTAAIGTSGDSEGLSAPDWYSRLFELDTSLRDIIDGLAMHPYTWPSTPAGADPRGTWAQIDKVHTILVKAGADGTRIFITEMGFPTGGPKRPTTKRYPIWEEEKPVSENNQAMFLYDTFLAVARLQSAGIVGEIDIFSLRDHAGSKKEDTEAHYGLTYTNGKQKGTEGRNSWAVVEAFARAHR